MSPRELLEQIPELRGREVAMRRMFGGLSNRSYLLEGDFGRWVLRINGNSPGTDRAREARVLQCVAAAGLGPEVLRDDPEAGYLLYRYAERAPWSVAFARTAAGQQQLGRWLRRLQALAARVERVDPLAALQGYIAALPARRQEPLQAELDALEPQLSAVGYREEKPVLCHFDLVAGNLLGHDEQLMAVDWEYAGLGPAPLELALYLHYQSLSVGQAQPLLESYADPAQQDRLVAILPPYLALASLLERSWVELKATMAEPPAG